MKKFEYKIVTVPVKSVWTGKIDEDLLLNTLNDLGKEGWEVVTVSPPATDMSSKDRFIILKKEIN
ncbi:DUF4177 domain-containing protein [Sediminibacterium roseum]|uniref:DUF4177 domain-containing protein n=1 Tax=Sediminibacterium roseum TaxID=1978412 RepID=A0ABW9ZWZ1_9BACT|nr:DUF4177 domain-containing protein [Sediminibacterium roseum]NCI50232.1 DUF4177 domain-containing protein [Sediminibacterium roseum]